MKTSQDQFDKLGEPYAFEEIKFRPQGKPNNGRCMCIPYIRASAARKRLNDIFKPWNWHVEYREMMGPVFPTPKDDARHKDQELSGAVICRLTVTTIEGHTVVREGIAGFSDIESAKGGESDAFKRAFAALGNDTLQKAELGMQACEVGNNGQFKYWKDLASIQRAYHQAMHGGKPEQKPRSPQVEMGSDPFTPLDEKALGKWVVSQKWNADQYSQYKVKAGEKPADWKQTLNSAIAAGCKTYDECVKHLEEN